MIIYQDMVPVTSIENINKNKPTLCIAEKSRSRDLLKRFSINTGELFFNSDQHTHIENLKNFDYIFLKAMDLASGMSECHVQIFYNKKLLLFLYDNKKCMEPFIDELASRQKTDLPLDMVLFLYFNVLTGKDSFYLEQVEDEIEDLEDSIETEKNLNRGGYIRPISDLRKKLLRLKRYYESLLDLLVDMEGNINGFIGDGRLRLMEVQKNHTEHLYNFIVNLHEYITQVKEGYQTQLDISQNKIMQYLTVITAIFLPLSVIAAWYGMNFRMPEFESEYAYPIIIILSAAIVTISIAFLKKKKWF